MKTYAYGFPRLGKNREFKKVIESFWKGETSAEEAGQALKKLQAGMLAAYEQSVDLFPNGEITAYDQMLDTAIMVGLYHPKNLKEYYDLCRGKEALEMTKWFNTNYHYLVPDFSRLSSPVKFSFAGSKPSGQGTPFFIGPFTFLKLSKGIPKAKFAGYLKDLAKVYRDILNGSRCAHIEEPALVMDLTKDEVKAVQEAYRTIAESRCEINLITYYGSVDAFKEVCALPVTAIGLDFIHGPDNLKSLKKYGFPADKTLIAGIVDGRNIWRTDVKKSVVLLKEISKSAKNVVISNAAPLYHLPIALDGENKLAPALKDILAFAEEKLKELRTIADAYDGKIKSFSLGQRKLGRHTKTQARLRRLTVKDFKKNIPLLKRKKLQQARLNLPLFPTTTIGSFPQTTEVRKNRADFRAGRISKLQYDELVKAGIREVIRWQEDLGLDVLVHGEFERTDMVEFFAEKLEGIATTVQGWIISYGTRAYRPPIIFGDIYRAEPMTLAEITYAQTLTKKPVKGMLTGPVTIIAWSFVREDIPLKNVSYQIALALQDEIRDYEKAGIRIVQVDEPAIREKAPIKHREWPAYFDWAIKSFRLLSNTDPVTQIHTHVCYSEFGEIIDQIDKMDFDVISIETTRSRGDIIQSFEKINFQKQIGLGVWDIHSPAVPTVENMREVVRRALKVIPKENFWINPDCGLKTRNWEETRESLKNLIALTENLRKR